MILYGSYTQRSSRFFKRQTPSTQHEEVIASSTPRHVTPGTLAGSYHPASQARVRSWVRLLCMRRFLLWVPERDPGRGRLMLLLALVLLAINVPYPRLDIEHISRYALVLFAFLLAALYFIPDDRHRTKLVLRLVNLFLAFGVSLPLLLVTIIVN